MSSYIDSSIALRMILDDPGSKAVRAVSTISPGKHLRSLDAIYPGRATLLAPDGITVVMHDIHMKEVADGLGLTVIDPAEWCVVWPSTVTPRAPRRGPRGS
ncbi:hypothetical protein [Myceligenerans pegani]|uniref:Type II toxin-antitoxin system VapC family toxin n=1 Tax=Myceligenerans pegani TaxID=2776917 RepID=A0ABR9MW02_9MICO|nr:hypothetical protein [Myceligenerans sp. TRM 65318]MBE1875570.1 hypothetical protein [Myceligenerans sp. TRM 65318]MBE3017841.1 hypothetical protein [Myceligenerans sp. TRM 65318]